MLTITVLAMYCCTAARCAYKQEQVHAMLHILQLCSMVGGSP